MNLVALMLEAVKSSERSTNFHQKTPRNNSEDSYVHTLRFKNVKSHLQTWYLVPLDVVWTAWDHEVISQYESVKKSRSASEMLQGSVSCRPCDRFRRHHLTATRKYANRAHVLPAPRLTFNCLSRLHSPFMNIWKVPTKWWNYFKE
jgi:hypothetical protein